MPFDAQLFITAQAGRSERPAFEKALGEIQAGHKEGCWIWYILPQLLLDPQNASQTSRKYALASKKDAQAYLDNEQLRTNYNKILDAILEKLSSATPTPLLTLMGKDVDVKKLASSLTLFAVAAQEKYPDLSKKCIKILGLTQKQGFGLCQLTLKQVGPLPTDLTSKPSSRSGTPSSPLRAVSPRSQRPPESSSPPQRKSPKKSPQSPLEASPPSATSPPSAKPPEAQLNKTLKKALETHMLTRDKEPDRWYQGLFKGYKKQDKLEAAIGLYRALGFSSKKQDITSILNSKPVSSSKPFAYYRQILRQGRLGDTLRKIAKSDNFVQQAKAKLQSPDVPLNTVRGLIKLAEKRASKKKESTPPSSPAPQ